MLCGQKQRKKTQINKTDYISLTNQTKTSKQGKQQQTMHNAYAKQNFTKKCIKIYKKKGNRTKIKIKEYEEVYEVSRHR